MKVANFVSGVFGIAGLLTLAVVLPLLALLVIAFAYLDLGKDPV